MPVNNQSVPTPMNSICIIIHEDKRQISTTKGQSFEVHNTG